MTLDDRYLPTAIVLPFEGHARQSNECMHKFNKGGVLISAYQRMIWFHNRVVENRVPIIIVTRKAMQNACWTKDGGDIPNERKDS